METTYENLNELNKYEPELTERLKANVTIDIWIEEPITVFHSLKEYALFVIDSYPNAIEDMIYQKSSVSPLKFINHEAFAQALIDEEYEHLFFDSVTGYVLQTEYEWN